MSYHWYDFVGNIGIILILGAYGAIQIGKLTPQMRLYSIMNAAGAALILVSLYFDFNLSAFLIEIAWLLISLYALLFPNQKAV